MKTDFSQLPREEVEARITTMLMGEMPADEARELMEFVAADRELMRLHDELKATISLVAEATAVGEEVKLSEGQREEVLKHFKVIPASELELEIEKRSSISSWVALAAMIVFLVGVAGMMLPTLSKSKSKSMRVATRAVDDRERGRFEELAEARAQKEFESLDLSKRQEEEKTQAGAPPTKIELPTVAQESGASPRGFFDISGALAAGKEGGAAERRLTPIRDEEVASRPLAIGEGPAKSAYSFGAAVAQKDIRVEPEFNKTPAAAKAELLGLQGGAKTGSGINRSEVLPQKPAEQKAAEFEVFGDFDSNSTGVAQTEGKLLAGRDKTVAGKNVQLSYEESPKQLEAAKGRESIDGLAQKASVDDFAAADLTKKADAPMALAVPEDRLALGVESIPAEHARSAGGATTSAEVLAEGLNKAAGPQGAQMVGVGGISTKSIEYYRQNPELMKRYFPQMYAMMLRSGETDSNSTVAGLEDSAGTTTNTLGRKSEQQLALGYQPTPMLMRPNGSAGNDRYRQVTPTSPPPPSQRPVQGDRYRYQMAPARPPLLTPQQLATGRRLAEVDAKAKKNESKELVEQRQEKLVEEQRQAVVQDFVRGDEADEEANAKEYHQAKTLYEGLRAKRPEELRQALRQSYTDETLNRSLDRLAEAEKEIGAKQKSVSRNDQEEKKLAASIEELNQQINDRVAGVMSGLEATVKARKAMLDQLAEQKKQVAEIELKKSDPTLAKPAMPAAVPQPEVQTAENAFSTFSLNVSDVSFKLAAASLEKGLMPEAATVRSEEFINAFDYRDPEPKGAPVGFVWERARYPFAQNRDLLRFSVKTAASGRQAGRPLNLVLLLDSSGSMERADRVRILQECLKTLAVQLRPEDRISVVAFARTARLWVDGLPGSQANELPARVGNLAPEGGTNLEEAMKVAYETARKHFSAQGMNRVVLLTDGAANLGDVEPESLKRKVEAERKKGIALDCFGIGWEGLNDELLETLSRNGDGRYGFVNTPEAAGSEFAGQLAGALQVAASDVKVQVEWNPKRVTAYRQIGYAKHQLTKEQFRDNTVDAAEIGAAEAGNALYAVQVNAGGEGPLGTVRVRFKVPGTSDYREHAWPLNYEGAAKGLETSSYPLRLAGTASAFSEWLVSSPHATEVTTDRLLSILSGVPEHFAPDPRPKKLEWMIRQAKSVAGR